MPFSLTSLLLEFFLLFWFVFEFFRYIGLDLHQVPTCHAESARAAYRTKQVQLLVAFRLC